MRPAVGALACIAFLTLVSGVEAHGALELNQFDTYALSDFEGQEDSFPWEGFEIWDVYVGDGYALDNDTHAVYFKGNFAGDGTVRPSGGQVWTLRFDFTVGADSYQRSIEHDGTDVTTDFEQLEWQVADGNVFQVHAWVPVPEWEGLAVTDLVVRSEVDGALRDVAPGGVYDPATGQEVPVTAPPSPAFPAMGEGRIVDAVPLTGAAKFLDVAVTERGGAFDVTVNNTLASQGQHFMLRLPEPGDWTVEGLPDPGSLEGGAGTAFTLTLTPAAEGIVEPLRLDFVTDIGGLWSWYAFADDEGVHVVDDAAAATPYSVEMPMVESPGLPLAWVVGLLAVAVVRVNRR